jgi:hypothetical protein
MLDLVQCQCYSNRTQLDRPPTYFFIWRRVAESGDVGTQGERELGPRRRTLPVGTIVPVIYIRIILVQALYVIVVI